MLLFSFYPALWATLTFWPALFTSNTTECNMLARITITIITFFGPPV